MISPFAVYILSIAVIKQLGFELPSASREELAHPLHPMQPYDVHDALHNVQYQHHRDGYQEEGEGSK